jgi:hypothetical protein
MRRNEHQRWSRYLDLPTAELEPMTADEVRAYRAALPPDNRSW